MLKFLRRHCVCSRQQSLPIIINALVWAAVIIASSWLTAPKDDGSSGIMLAVLTTGWFITNSLVTRMRDPN